MCFYSKWTQLEGFQRTRGVLRTFALALREAEKWGDESPLVGANAFLVESGKTGISEAARDLTTVAGTEEYEGRKQEWTGILEGELAKARDIQAESPALKFREIEQAVFATFLHSQPIGQKALTRNLMVLLGPTRPDKIELEKGLNRWAEVSWFLDEESGVERVNINGASKQLPKTWKLGSRPNLRQMHYDACQRVSPEVTEARLIDEIGKLKNLTAGASGAGATVHNLPKRPNEIEDDGEFHFAVLGPRAASDSGKASAEAKRYIDETAGSDKPRNYRNAVVLAVPSKDGIEAARNRIREALGWDEVRSQLREQLKGKELDPIREATLSTNISAARSKITEQIQQAYSVVVTVSEKNEVQAFKLSVDSGPLFAKIKSDSRSRIQDTAISAEALLPDGPYDLWRAGEKSRRLKDLVGAFALSPQLPKMLNRGAILDTLILGCKEGRFVLRVARPDRSIRTFWRQEPDEAARKDPSLEVVLPEAAELTDIASELLVPRRLQGLWDSDSVSFGEILAYFSGTKIVKDQYNEPIAIPKAPRSLVESAISQAVKQRQLWLTSGQASILAEDIPAGILTEDALLHEPPRSIPAADVTRDSMPDVWSEQSTSAFAIAVGLSKKSGINLPWIVVREAIDGALLARLLEHSPGTSSWPCDYASAQNAKFNLPTQKSIKREEVEAKPDVLAAEAELRPNQIQDLADALAEIKKAAGPLDLKFRLRVEIDDHGSKPASSIVTNLNDLLRKISGQLVLK